MARGGNHKVVVKVGKLRKEDLADQMMVIETAAREAVVRGVNAGIADALRQFGSTTPTPPPIAKRIRVAAPEAKARRKASPRQRGTLDRDATVVFNWLRENPDSRNDQISIGTGLDPRTVGAAIRYLRGFNVRGDVVRDALIELPDGDRRRYTAYRVIEGATMAPAESAGDLPSDLLPPDESANVDTAQSDGAEDADDMDSDETVPPSRIVEPEEEA